MRITVDENGKADPPNSADLLAEVNEAVDIPSGGAIPDSPVAWRTFQCRACKHSFEARARETTVHECPSE